MKRESFIKKMNNQMEVYRMLIYFLGVFETYVRKYDGKVYNVRIRNDFNNSEPHYQGDPSAPHCRVSVEYNGLSLSVYTSLKCDYKSIRIESGHSSKCKAQLVGPDNRISLKSYLEIEADWVAELNERIAYYTSLLAHLDEYVKMYEEFYLLVQDVRKVLPSELQNLTRFYNIMCDSTVFSNWDND